ncbi:hypothetical protein niasHS_005017 [Heterodera schachtii]|uniref:B30.2/SPRY domain-containing protein n=1 Tax=Heterodera schachtii TaxID=97005 RepID=A0ABD2JKB1_HETSC
MSISINSINCVDDLIPAAENGEVNGGAINLDNYGQFDGRNSESITDQQQLKELREKFAKMEMELKMAKLELENKEQKLKLHELIGEQKAFNEKLAKIEQKNDAKCLTAHHFGNGRAVIPNLSTSEEMSVLIARIAELNRANTVEPSIASSCDLFGQDGNAAAEERFSQLQNDQKKIFEKINELEKQQKEQTKANADQSDQLSKILEKINEMEKQQKQQYEEITTKAILDQFSEMQNDQKIFMEKVSELEKEQKQKQRKAFLNFQQNYWDANFCHDKLEIIGKKSLTVHHKGNTSGWGSVFAKHPILLNNNSSDIFYYEILVKNKKSWFISFGFAVKQQNKLEGTIHSQKGTYAYECNGEIYINGESKGKNGKYSYGSGDTVGIGVNSATQQIIFTKNGLRLDFSDFLVDPSFADDSFHPFVFLLLSDDKIEANFGPIFKFDLTTL